MTCASLHVETETVSAGPSLSSQGLDDVLCYAWRGDNYGPAEPPEVREDFRLFGAHFPNATILASTLGDYFGALADAMISDLS